MRMSRDLVCENRRRARSLQGSEHVGAKQSPSSTYFRVRAHFGGSLSLFYSFICSKITGEPVGFARCQECGFLFAPNLFGSFKWLVGIVSPGLLGSHHFRTSAPSLLLPFRESVGRACWPLQGGELYGQGKTSEGRFRRKSERSLLSLHTKEWKNRVSKEQTVFPLLGEGF